jgi:pimeloyl-ACP methyl ester carboxylesterase
MAYKNIQQSKLFYIDQGKGFPLLLGHSYLFDHTMWQPQMGMLTQYYRVIATDLWGHGQSDEIPKSCMSLQDFAQDHLTLMQQLDIKEFAIIGLSVGGMWAAEMAIAAPTKVKALVMMDSFIGAEKQQAYNEYFNVLNSIEQNGTIVPKLLDYIVEQFYTQASSAPRIKNLRTYLSNLSTGRILRSIVPLGRIIFGRTDRLAFLEKINAPSLIITGEEDKPRPPQEGEQMAKILGCKHKIIKNAGHISNQEQPEIVTNILHDFLNQHLN